MSLLEITHPLSWLALAGVEVYLFAASSGTFARAFAGVLAVACAGMAVRNYRRGEY